MALSLNELATLRPFAYHLTARQNLRSIREGEVLYSAATLMARADKRDLLGQKRIESLCIPVDGRGVSIRDQKPLHRGNIVFEDNWTFETLLKTLNELVFFWPGAAVGPIGYGLRHFERYIGEKPVLIRCPMSELIQLNPSPLLCAYNSGSPRCSSGRRSPRGQSTFLPPAAFTKSPSKVVEVTFCERVRLPYSTEAADCPKGPWTGLLNR